MHYQRYAWIIGGAAVLVALIVVLGSRPSQSQTTTPARMYGYVVNGDIHLASSNARGEKLATTTHDVLRIFDQLSNGTILYARQYDKELPAAEGPFRVTLWMLRQNGQNVKFTDDLVSSAEFMPNGADVLYGTETMDLILKRVDGTSKKLVSKALSPSVSPDGRTVVYQKLNDDWMPGEYYDRATGLVRLDVGTVQETRLTDTWEDFDPSWSPDGSTIAFSSGRTQLASIWVMDADGKNQRQITNVGETFYTPGKTMLAPAHAPQWANDGRHLIYESERKIWSVELNTSRTKLILAKQLAFGEQPVWLDDQTIAVLSVPSSTTSPKTLKIKLNGDVIQ